MKRKDILAYNYFNKFKKLLINQDAMLQKKYLKSNFKNRFLVLLLRKKRLIKHKIFMFNHLTFLKFKESQFSMHKLNKKFSTKVIFCNKMKLFNVN